MPNKHTLIKLILLTSMFLSSCSTRPALAAEIFKLTAYDACIKCCGKTDGITASGKIAKPHHTIACNWLPFGTKVKIMGEIYTVQDRGAKSLFGSKKNHIKHIDIFMPTHKEARNFGVRYEPVEILA